MGAIVEESATPVSPELQRLRDSGFFDAAWYAAEYPDVPLTGIDPAEHYLRFGAMLGRNPGPNFDTVYYLASNPDVAAARINPLMHYILHGREEGRTPRPFALIATDFSVREVDVIIPVYNALEYVQRCLEALANHRDEFKVQAIVVNDGSEAETTAWLRHFARSIRCSL